MNLEPSVQYINVENIIPNRFQPRLTFDDNALKELSLSIKEHGIIQPLVLRKLSNDKYEIIAGERRYKASQMAGLTRVPAIIADLDDNTSAEVALVENIQRRNLSAIEEAKSYQKLLDRGYLTQDQLARRLGISQPSIANKIRLLNLAEEVQEALMSEKISERHARSLLQITDKNAQIDMLNKIIDSRMTVRQLDSEIKEYLNPTKIEKLEEEKEEFNNYKFINSIEPIKFDIGSELEAKNDTEAEIEKLIFDSKKALQERYELFDIPTAEEVIPEEKQEETDKEENNSNKIIPGNIDSIISKFKELEKEIESAGFRIETEDYDFEDLYQIIIKIEK